MSRGFVCVWCGERVWCPATPDLDHGEHESPAARKHRRHIVNARHQSLPRAGQPQEGERMTGGTTVFDRHGLLQVFASMAGRRFVGVEDGGDCVELVFDNPETLAGTS